MKKIIMLMFILIMMVGCQSEADSNFDKFNTYCNSYCAAISMEQVEGTKADKYTYKCVCEKVFLKEDWLKEHGDVK